MLSGVSSACTLNMLQWLGWMHSKFRGQYIGTRGTDLWGSEASTLYPSSHRVNDRSWTYWNWFTLINQDNCKAL